MYSQTSPARNPATKARWDLPLESGSVQGNPELHKKIMHERNQVDLSKAQGWIEPNLRILIVELAAPLNPFSSLTTPFTSSSQQNGNGKYLWGSGNQVASLAIHLTGQVLQDFANPGSQNAVNSMSNLLPPQEYTVPTAGSQQHLDAG